MIEQKRLCGVGINDANYPVCVYRVIDGKQKRVSWCPFYRTWSNMIIRCYSPAALKRRSTYDGCKVCDEWHMFSAFKRWMEGKDWEGKTLDKDILLIGNKVYSPDTCVFVSNKLNNFLTDSGKSRGILPIGVTLDSRDGKFQSKINNPFTGKRESLGRFKCAEDAHKAWMKKKKEIALQYSEIEQDKRLKSALSKMFDCAGWTKP